MLARHRAPLGMYGYVEFLSNSLVADFLRKFCDEI